MSIYLGPQAKQERLRAKDAAVPIDIHRMSAIQTFASDAGKPVHAPPEVSRISEIEWPGAAKLFQHPIQRFLHHLHIGFRFRVAWLDTAGSPYNVANQRTVF